MRQLVYLEESRDGGFITIRHNSRDILASYRQNDTIVICAVDNEIFSQIGVIVALRNGIHVWTPEGGLKILLK